MTDITAEKQRLLALYAQKYCKFSDPLKCQHKPCTCSIAAEFRAFLNLTIPEGFRDFTFKDFHGRVGDTRLDTSVASRAKRQVFDYCWGDPSLLNRISMVSESELDKASIIAKRIERGHNVIIHGDSVKQALPSPDGKQIVKEKQLGRTFIASIITREVIKIRLDSQNPKFRMLNYEWVEFNSLVQALVDYGEESTHYETCDWLVIDNITETMIGASLAQKAYIERFIDAFVDRRYKAKRPTVFVFRFDVTRRQTEVDSSFGVTIGKIFRDKDTCVISLTQKSQEDNDGR